MAKLTPKTQTEILIQLYIAEYQALTTRAAYWTVLQFGFASVVPVYLTLVVNVWQNGPVWWLFFGGLHLIGILWVQTMLEQYDIVNYIECYLRPLIKDKVNDALFFGWEPYLINHRSMSWFRGWAFVPAFSLILFLTIIIFRFREFSYWDTVGLIVNLALLFILGHSIYKARKVMRRWSDYDKDLVIKLENIHNDNEIESDHSADNSD